MSDTKINTEHKDRLFSFIFGKEKNKKWTLALYNAVNHSDHSDPDDIEINTIEDYLYMGMKNDVSFLIHSSLNLYEHQSTYNPNMPMRQLIYLSQAYDKYIKKNKYNLYGGKKIEVPIPKLVTFYNGLKDTDDETDLYLSDLFPDDRNKDDADVSVRVHMFNINYGRNKELMDACKPLSEYAWFIERIRYYCRSMDIEKSVEHAMADMPDTFSIKEYLIANRSEVQMICLTEYNEAETMNMFKEEGRLEGLEAGRRENRQEDLRKLASHLMSRDPDLSEDEAMKQAQEILQ